MAEPDTAVLVEMVRVIIEALVSGDYPLDGVTVNDALAALDALAQRLVEAERMLADTVYLRDEAWDGKQEAEARATRAEEALRQIETGEVPCARCGKVHHVREDPERPAAKNLGAGVTWADPDDGHPYYRMAADAVARAALTPHRGA